MEINRTVTRCATLLLIIRVANCIGRLRSSSGAVSDWVWTRPIRNRIQARLSEDSEVRKWGKFACICLKIQSGSVLVGAIGFEPTTPCAQGRCATRLRYAPTVKNIRFRL
jgi:hypothetical protein